MCRNLRKKDKGNRDITLLLGLLMLLGFFVGCLSGRTQIRSMSMNAMLSNVHPFIISHSVEKIADFSKQLSVQSAHQLAKTIVSQWYGSLTRDDLLELLFAFSMVHKAEDKNKNLFLNLIPEYPFFEDGAPLAYVAAASGYAHFIPALEIWAKKYIETNKNGPHFLNDDTHKAVDYAIDKNEVAILKQILNYASSMRAEDYTNFLWRAVSEHGRDAGMISVLVRYGANPRSSRGSHTVLMKAVERNNVSAVKELIKLGADVNTILDDGVGSALQLALINNFVEMEQVLRAHGARE